MAARAESRERGRRAIARGRGAVAWYPPCVSDAPWTRLAAPFPVSDVVWDVVSVDAAGEEASVLPRLRREALEARLDEVFGVVGWSVTFVPFAEAAVGCTLEVQEVRKATVVNAMAGGAAVTAAAAFAGAAARFGLVAPVVPAERRVAFDPEAGVALHEPEVSADAVQEVTNHETSHEAAAATAASGQLHASLPDAREAVVPARGLSSDGFRMIDRLVERLKDEGQGLAAARLLVRFGGYGKDPDAARELYGELRALLKRAGESEAGA